MILRVYSVNTGESKEPVGRFIEKKPARSGAGFQAELREATTGFEPVIRVLQTLALPLGHVAMNKLD
jgi:hypothetical protein